MKSPIKTRRSNIEQAQITIRAALCQAMGVAEDDMPFAGERLQVRDDERDWEGAAERLMRGFGLSLLVPDAHYAAVADWVDRNHLKGRLVYFHVRPPRRGDLPDMHRDSLVRKLAIKPDSPFYDWLERYGWDHLSPLQWLSDCHLYYWGDIDTHGFAILNQLRSRFRHVESFMMDRVTLMEHEPLWGNENDQARHDLSLLTTDEQDLFNDLRDNRIRKNLRLEQEFIGFGWIENTLARLQRSTSY